MKKMIIAIVMMASCVSFASAQENKVTSDNNLQSYKEERLKNIPTVQAYQASDGTILKGADAFGWGIEPFAGAAFVQEGEHFTPEAGLNVRYDAKRFGIRVGGSWLQRQFNAEAMNAGQTYNSYAADAAISLNLLSRGYYTNILNVYVQGGYLFGKHNYKVGEAQVEEGTIVSKVKHNGSGITYGGGIEYRHQFFATGNSLNIRVGYKNVPNTFVNNTTHKGMFYAQIGFTFGVKRCKINAK